MTSKAYLVSWLGKGNIVWTPLDSVNGQLATPATFSGPMRHALDVLASKSDITAATQRILSPTLANLSSIQTIVSVGTGLSALAVGLQLVNLTLSYRILQTAKRIEKSVNDISGKFELHFMDRSLDFFLSCHQGTTGLISPAVSALEEDCYNALHELVSSKDLRVPAYLRMKLLSQAQAIESFNRLLYTVLHNGNVPEMKPERIAVWLHQSNSVLKALPPGAYAPQDALLGAYLNKLKTDAKWTPEKSGDAVVDKALERKLIDRTYPIVLLARELRTTQILLDSIEEKLAALPEKALRVDAA